MTHSVHFPSAFHLHWLSQCSILLGCPTPSPKSLDAYPPMQRSDLQSPAATPISPSKPSNPKPQLLGCNLLGPLAWKSFVAPHSPGLSLQLSSDQLLSTLNPLFASTEGVSVPTNHHPRKSSVGQGSAPLDQLQHPETESETAERSMGEVPGSGNPGKSPIPNARGVH